MRALFARKTKSASEVEVQYYVHGMSFGAENGFLMKLRSCLEKQSVDLKFTKDLSTRGSIPVLLFCVNATHVTNEARKALAQIGGRPAFLIVMNRFPKHSHRKNHHSASHVQAQNICAVLDCFFFDSDGMYDCVENTEVVKKVANQLVPMTSFTQQHDDSPRMCGIPSEYEGSAMCSDQEKLQRTSSTPPDFQYYTYPDQDKIAEIFLKTLEETLKKSSTVLKSEKLEEPPNECASITKPTLLFCQNKDIESETFSSDEGTIVIITDAKEQADDQMPVYVRFIRNRTARFVLRYSFSESNQNMNVVETVAATILSIMDKHSSQLTK